MTIAYDSYVEYEWESNELEFRQNAFQEYGWRLLLFFVVWIEKKKTEMTIPEIKCGAIFESNEMSKQPNISTNRQHKHRPNRCDMPL